MKKSKKNEHWVSGYTKTSAGDIPVVKTTLNFSDKLSNVKARWGINRFSHYIKPGLYAVGNPDDSSDVFVTSNYKLTFSTIRRGLAEMSAWILVLDTKGINVWCAAGKGTFGTQELVEKISTTGLKSVVSHRRLILPQLGAVGVSAHSVKKISGFKVIYGPVYAEDIKEFINNRYKKTDDMKKVHFRLRDRLSVVPVEVTHLLPFALILLAAMFVFNFIKFQKVSPQFLLDSIPFLGAMITGSVFFPILLPLLPSRSFAIKGLILGFTWAVGNTFLFGFNLKDLIINILLLSPIVSFLSLNFTGASTYTSLNGVKREVKYATPIFIVMILSGIILKLLSTLTLTGGQLWN